MENSLKQTLEEAVARINRPEFVDSDPVQFPRRFTSPEDIEIVSLLTSHIAWGNRKMICRDCEKLLELMHHEPMRFVAEGDFDEIEDGKNIHRTFFGRDLKYFLRGLHQVYKRHGSLEAFAASEHIGADGFPSWCLAAALNRELASANEHFGQSQRCLPGTLETTPLKGLNMALRWLVRDDGIVDMGVWKLLKPSQLFIPLDVHVADTSRQFGLLTRKSNDRKAVVELTDVLRKFDREDPVKYDFALFGLGVSGE